MRIAIFTAGILLIAGIFYLIRIQSIRGATFTEGIVTRNLIHGINQREFGSTMRAEIKYFAGDSIVTFPGPEGQIMQVGEIVPVVYHENDKVSAQVYTFDGFWLHGLIWCILPLILWVALCFSLVDVRSI